MLVTQHNETGTTGIILNQNLPGEKIKKNIYGSSDPVVLQYGGPDNEDIESYLILYPSFKNGWIDSLFWSYDTMDIVTILHFISEYNIQISAYKGCIKWKPGKLEKDLEQSQWWLTNDYQIHNVMMPGNTSWKYYAKQHGGFYGPLVEADLPVNFN